MVPKLRFSDPNTSPGQVAKVVVWGGGDVLHRRFTASCLFGEGGKCSVGVKYVRWCLQMLTGRLWVPLREAGSADPQAAEAAFSKQVCVIVSEKNKRNLSVEGAGVCRSCSGVHVRVVGPSS